MLTNFVKSRVGLQTFQNHKARNIFFGIRLINNYGIPAIDNHPAPNFRN